MCGKGGLSRLRRGGRKFFVLEMKVRPDGFSVRNFLRIRALKREREQERLYLKEGSSLKPLRKIRSSTVQHQKSR